MKNSVKTILLILIIVFALGLQGQEITQESAPVEREIMEMVGQMTGRDHLTFSNPIEEHIVQKSLYPILKYLKQTYPEEQWKSCTEHLHQGESLSKTLIDVYRRTPAQVIIELIQSLREDLPGFSQGTMIEKEINGFTVSFHDKEQPNTDYLYIEYLIKTYSEGIGKFFWNGEPKKTRYQNNLKNIKGGCIRVLFITDADELNKVFRIKWQTAVTNMNLKKVGDQLYIEISLLFPYPHLIITSTFAHELAHVIQLLSMVDDGLTQPFSVSQMNSDQTKERMKDLISVISSLGGGPLNEGMAEFLSEQHNLMYKYRFIDDIDTQLRQYFRRTGNSFELINLPQKIKDPDIDTRILGYHVAHSFFRYIFTRFGKDKALRLMASPERNQDYQDILGINLETLDKDWHQYIRTEEESSGISRPGFNSS